MSNENTPGSIQEALDKLVRDAGVQALMKRNQELEASTTAVQGNANAVLEELRFLRRLAKKGKEFYDYWQALPAGQDPGQDAELDALFTEGLKLGYLK